MTTLDVSESVGARKNFESCSGRWRTTVAVAVAVVVCTVFAMKVVVCALAGLLRLFQDPAARYIFLTANGP
jgi:hypothetical protein